MKKLENNQIVQVTIPFSKALESGTIWGQGAYLLMVEGSPQYSAILDGVKVKVSEINFIEDNFTRAIIGAAVSGEAGFSVNWLKSDNRPYIEILKADLVEEFDNHKKLENDTHYLIPMMKYIKRTKPNYVKFEEIMQWVAAYAKPDFSNIYSDPSVIADLKNANYPQPKEL